MPLLSFLLLGAFWGLSPTLYKAMAPFNMPISHIIVLTSVGVGLGLAAVLKIQGNRVFSDRRLIGYGLGCGILINIPMGLQILFARHVPAAELAVIFSTAPFFNYLLALATKRDIVTSHRILGLLAGFLASAILILTRDEASIGSSLAWTLGAFICPVLYAFYNLFTSTRWPAGANVASVGMAESFGSAFVALPFLIVFALPGIATLPPIPAYWPILVLTLMWVLERILYFSLLREKGPVYTVQAIYVAAPAGVIYGMIFFGERPDLWLWVSLGGIVLALWLNNRRAVTSAV